MQGFYVKYTGTKIHEEPFRDDAKFETMRLTDPHQYVTDADRREAEAI